MCATPVMAQEVKPAYSLINLTNYLGVGLVVIGAAFGISRLASSAYDGMSVSQKSPAISKRR